MDQLLIVRVPYSHVFRGVNLRLERTRASDRVGDLGEGVDLLLLFADGSQAVARLAPGNGGRLDLEVAAYTTARGTSVSARAWAVASIVDCRGTFDLRLGDGHLLPNL